MQLEIMKDKLILQQAQMTKKKDSSLHVLAFKNTKMTAQKQGKEYNYEMTPGNESTEHYLGLTFANYYDGVKKISRTKCQN